MYVTFSIFARLAFGTKKLIELGEPKKSAYKSTFYSKMPIAISHQHWEEELHLLRYRHAFATLILRKYLAARFLIYLIFTSPLYGWRVRSMPGTLSFSNASLFNALWAIGYHS